MELRGHIQTQPDFQTKDSIRFVRVGGDIHVSDDLNPGATHKKIVEEDGLADQVQSLGDKARADAGFMHISEKIIIASGGSLTLKIPLGFGQAGYEENESAEGPRGTTLSILKEIFPGRDVISLP